MYLLMAHLAQRHQIPVTVFPSSTDWYDVVPMVGALLTHVAGLFSDRKKFIPSTEIELLPSIDEVKVPDVSSRRHIIPHELKTSMLWNLPMPALRV